MVLLNVWQGMKVDSCTPYDLKARELVSDFLKPNAKALYLGKIGEPAREWLNNRLIDAPLQSISKNKQWADLTYLDLTDKNNVELQVVFAQAKPRGKILVCANAGSREFEQSLLKMRQMRIFVKEKHFTADGKVLIEARA